MIMAHQPIQRSHKGSHLISQISTVQLSVPDPPTVVSARKQGVET